jgi:nitrogen regulatory protein PII
VKKVEAYIKPNMLTATTEALHGINGMLSLAVLKGKGFGKLTSQNLKSPYDFEPIVKLEIICQDESCKEIVGVLEKVAHTGLRSDGCIIVTTIEQDIRIVTWEPK